MEGEGKHQFTFLHLDKTVFATVLYCQTVIDFQSLNVLVKCLYCTSKEKSR